MATSFKDLIPLRDRVDVGEVTLARPSAEEVERQKEKTKEALAILISGASAAQKPSLIKKQRDNEPTFVKYTPADQFGEQSTGRERIIRIQNKQEDPMEPPKFKHKKVPRGPPTPPRPVVHSPPRKLTAEDQAAWRIPPAVSSWKNPKGYTRGIDKLLAARPNVEDVTINDKFSQLADALHTADRHAREEVKKRAQMQQLLAEKAKSQKEDELRALAQQARQNRGGAGRQRRDSSPSGRYSRSRSGSQDRGRRQSESPSHSRTSSQDSDVRTREKARADAAQERQKALRQSRMGTERRLQMLAREQNRDISEKIALGLAKPSQSSESMYDSRLFNQNSAFDSGYNEDQVYDKPLFAAQNAINNIYRPNASAGAEDDEGEGDGGATMDRIQKANRFEVLGKAAKGFRGADIAEPRSGPVVFERDRGTTAAGKAPTNNNNNDNDDPFGIDDMIRNATGGKQGGSGNKKRGGEGRDDDHDDDSDDRGGGKRPRVEDSD